VPIHHDVDKEAGILRISVEGLTTEEDWTGMLAAIAADPDFRPSMGLLIDVRKHESIASSEVMWKISQRAGADATNARWAIVVSRVVSEGMSFMLSALVEKSGFQVKVFREIDKAEAWLKSEQ